MKHCLRSRVFQNVSMSFLKTFIFQNISLIECYAREWLTQTKKPNKYGSFEGSQNVADSMQNVSEVNGKKEKNHQHSRN
jgi:hypothetical protein